MSDEVLGDPAGFRTGVAVGSRIAGYRLEGQIGRGGMAEVFLARDERLGRLVALKILAPALAMDEGFRQRFIRESRAAAAVDDPHIVPVYEAGEADGVLFIAMRYVPGGDARSLVHREGPMPPWRAAAIISPVASALDAAHAAGLLHRDVKPANMLVDVVQGRPDHVYLSDFGLSKAAMSSVGLTRKGEFLGTPEYVSPEQIAGQPADGRADEYALACSAFELLTGAPPFHRDEAVAVMYAHMSAPPPRLTSLRPDLPPAADGVLAKALAKAPADRYHSCRDFADALRVTLGLQPYDTGPGPVRADYPQTHTAWPAAGGWVPQGAPAGAATQPPRQSPDYANLPTGRAATPVSPPPGMGVGQPGGYAAGGYAAGGRGAQGPRRRRLRTVAVALGTAAVLAAAGVTAILLSSSHHPAPVVSQITAKSALPAVTGDVYVVYLGGTDANASLSGEVKDTTSGEVARLYAQQFPYHGAPAPAGSVVLHPADGTARYAFQVSPSLATRYKVEVFGDSAATASLASSPTTTVYVTQGATSGSSQTCARPVCHETIPVRVFVPASALSTEISKQWYTYFNVNLAPTVEPAPPAMLLLGAGGAQASTSQRVSATEFDLTVTFSFTIGNDAYHWRWRACLKSTEAQDGMGLPGSHGCGAQTTAAAQSYLG